MAGEVEDLSVAFFRKRPRSLQGVRLLNVTGIEDFDLETEPGLFGFSGDEFDGPVIVTLDSALVGERIEIGALRELLDRAEAETLRHREERQAVERPQEDGGTARQAQRPTGNCG